MNVIRGATRLAIAGLAGFGLSPGAAQRLAPPNPELVQKAGNEDYEGRTLAALADYRAAFLDASCRPIDPLAGQLWSLYQAAVTGRPRAAGGVRSASGLASIADAVPRDALAAIAARAAATRIVILNEDHSVPRSRAFAQQVAETLRKQGYGVLAAEAFDATDMARLARDGYATFHSGLLLRDPVFAGFVRRALAIGYRPIAYEAPLARMATMQAREDAEADNLATILAAHPDAKIFVYVGFGHLAETTGLEDGPALRHMGLALKQKTGIDPLTIDQTALLESGTSTLGTAAYAAASRHVGRRSAILLRDGQPLVLGFPRGAVDLQVVHPRVGPVEGRPGWLLTDGRAPRPAPARFRPVRGVTLVRAYRPGDAPDAVPLDQVLWRAGGRRPFLILPRGGAVRYSAETSSASLCLAPDGR